MVPGCFSRILRSVCLFWGAHQDAVTAEGRACCVFPLLGAKKGFVIVWSISFLFHDFFFFPFIDLIEDVSMERDKGDASSDGSPGISGV